MEHLWMPDIPVWDKILRSGVIYLFILLAFRFTGKRQVGQLTPFDLVVLLIISNVVQNSLIGNDNSIGGGMIGAVTILALNWVVVEITYRFKPFRRLMEGTPTVLIHNGKIIDENLRRERLTLEDLQGALRKNGVFEVHQVRVAILVRRKRQKEAVRVALVQILRADVGAPLKATDEIYLGGEGAEGVFHLLDLLRRRAVLEFEEYDVAENFFFGGMGGNDGGEQENDCCDCGGEKFDGLEFENRVRHCGRLRVKEES